MNSIHGHDVIDLIASAGRPFAKDELVQAIEQQFGADTRFHTCSAEGMTAAELVAFFIARNKLSGGPAALTLNTGEICQH